MNFKLDNIILFQGNLIQFILIFSRFSNAAIERGLPQGYNEIENSPSVEVDETLLTHINGQQIWAVGGVD